MKIEQIYTGCLAQGAYYIESDGEAAVIDPLREVSGYIKRAEKDKATIKYVFETHFHADFVSGHVDLSKKTGATIVYGPNAVTGFEAHIAKDLETFKIGRVTVQLLHTPGHTLESVCYLLFNEEHKAIALFSGDTLFIGDVGRPDLAQKSNLTKFDLAGMLFDSLRGKIMPLANDVIVYPAHGAGSACGKNMSKETSDTLGNQKLFNYALRADMTRDEFISEVTAGLTEPPQYFPENVKMNREGSESFESVLKRGVRALSASDFEDAANHTEAIILDTRDAKEFSEGFIPNSINIGLVGSFAPWLGALVPDLKQHVLLVANEGTEEEVITRMARVGYDHTIGYLEGGFETWKKAGKEVDSIENVPAMELGDINFEKDTIVDVRKPNEFAEGHVAGALNLPLDYINDVMEEFPKSGKMFIHCAGGYRSMVAASILKSRGFDDIVNVEGGFGAIQKAGVEVTSEVSV